MSVHGWAHMYLYLCQSENNLGGWVHMFVGDGKVHMLLSVRGYPGVGAPVCVLVDVRGQSQMFLRH